MRAKQGYRAAEGLTTYDLHALNYPAYVVQWGATDDFLAGDLTSLQTNFLNEEDALDYRATTLPASPTPM